MEGFDVVVVGGGTAGLAAAIAARDEGARVCVLEKREIPGGVGVFAEGLFAVESDLQKALYVDYSSDEAYRDFLAFSHYRANPTLVRTFVCHTAETVRWLRSLGVEFEGVFTNVPGGPMVWHIVKGMGKAVIERMVQRAQGIGIPVRYGTKVRGLSRAEGGWKVEVEDLRGQREEVFARAVVLATGGYANNGEWIGRYGYTLGKDLIAVGHEGKMGEGISLGLEVGATVEGMGVFQLIRVSPYVAPVPLEALGFQPCLHVNVKGRRYVDESVTAVFPFDANAIARQPERTVFVIFDEAHARYWSEEGLEVGLGRIIPPKTKVDVLREIERALEEGMDGVGKADGVEELARHMGLPEGALAETVREYNSFCERGYDPQFGKPAKYLRPLSGRLYAIRCKLGFLGTLGGLKVDGDLQVVDKEGNPIGGLFAAGLDAGGLYGDTYDVTAAGTTFSFALTSGRLAGKNAARVSRMVRP